MLGDWAKRPSTRARDIDREYVAGMLRDATVEGQLSSDEFDDRLRMALTARRLGELVPLVADLQSAEPMTPRHDSTAVLPPVPSTLLPRSSDLLAPVDEMDTAPVPETFSGSLALLTIILFAFGVVVLVWGFTT